RRGTRLIEYKGERISSEEANARYDDDQAEHPHILMFNVDEHTLIDAGVGGNEARFFNHSCDPNCEAVTEDGRIYLQAICTIAPAGELPSACQPERRGRFDPAWEELYACWCGAPNCRGTMLLPRPKRRRRARSS